MPLAILKKQTSLFSIHNTKNVVQCTCAQNEPDCWRQIVRSRNAATHRLKIGAIAHGKIWRDVVQQSDVRLGVGRADCGSHGAAQRLLRRQLEAQIARTDAGDERVAQSCRHTVQREAKVERRQTALLARQSCNAAHLDAAHQRHGKRVQSARRCRRAAKRVL